MLRFKLSEEIAIAKESGQKKTCESKPSFNLPTEIAPKGTSTAGPPPTKPKTFSIGDIVAHKIRLLERGKNPERLLNRAINLRDMNTSCALLDMRKWNDTEGPKQTFPIHEAAITGDIQLFHVVLKNTKNKWVGAGNSGKTALEFAALHGHQGISEILLEPTNFEADVEIPFKALKGAIKQAEAGGHQNLAKWLTGRLRGIEKAKKEQDFMLSVERGDSVAVKDFLEVGISKPQALAVALRNSRTGVASLLLQSMENGHSYNLFDAIDQSAALGDLGAVELVLSKVPDMERQRATHQALTVSLDFEHKQLSRQLLKSSEIDPGFALKQGALFRDPEVVTWSLRNNVSGLIDKSCLTAALHYAITPDKQRLDAQLSNWTKVVQLLLEGGAELETGHGFLGSALRHAAANGEPAIVKLLLGHGADVNAQGIFGGSSPLMIAISAGDLSTTRVLIEHCASLQNLKGIAGNGLQTASFLGVEIIVKELLDRGADVDAHLDPWGTPLVLALQGNHPGVARLLLSRGANVKVDNPECGTALHIAAMLGLEELTKLLVAASADVDAKGGVYCTALQAAISRGHKIIALFLLDHGADVNIQGGVHGNALQAAYDRSDCLMIKLLLLSGARAKKPIDSSLLH
jgi:ankyrin repeat protein